MADGRGEERREENQRNVQNFDVRHWMPLCQAFLPSSPFLSSPFLSSPSSPKEGLVLKLVNKQASKLTIILPIYVIVPEL